MFRLQPASPILGPASATIVVPASGSLAASNAGDMLVPHAASNTPKPSAFRMAPSVARGVATFTRRSALPPTFHMPRGGWLRRYNGELPAFRGPATRRGNERALRRWRGDNHLRA